MSVKGSTEFDVTSGYSDTTFSSGYKIADTGDTCLTIRCASDTKYSVSYDANGAEGDVPETITDLSTFDTVDVASDESIAYDTFVFQG